MKTQPYGNKRSRPSDRGSWARGEVIQVFACFTPFSLLSAVLLNYAKASCSCSSGGGGGGWKGSSSQAYRSRCTNNCWRSRASRFDKAQGGEGCRKGCRVRDFDKDVPIIVGCGRASRGHCISRDQRNHGNRGRSIAHRCPLAGMGNTQGGRVAATTLPSQCLSASCSGFRVGRCQRVPSALASVVDEGGSPRGCGQRTSAKRRFVERWRMLTLKREEAGVFLYRTSPS